MHSSNIEGSMNESEENMKTGGVILVTLPILNTPPVMLT